MKKTKKAWLIASSLAFVMALAVAVPLYANAQTTTSATGTAGTDKTYTKTIKGHKNLTAAQLAALKQKAAASRAALAAKQTAINNALAANDYNAWLTAVGGNSAIAKKITASNFPKLVEIYNLEKQIQQDKTDLGISNNGLGMGWGEGLGEGFGYMKPVTATTTNQ